MDEASIPTQPGTPGTGWNVVHLFWHTSKKADAVEVLDAIERARKRDHQVVTAAMFGHKADLCVMALGPDPHVLRQLQTEIRDAGLTLADSYVSLTEVSEYAAGLPDEMRQARLYPTLPPDGKPAFCFYPMSKRRSPGAENWYTLGYSQRLELMRGHGSVGRAFRGRVLQLITGSTGIDDYEWGVTLFAVRMDDLKECVYAMRFDPGSALYAEFGPFFTGMVGDAPAVLAEIGLEL